MSSRTIVLSVALFVVANLCASGPFEPRASVVIGSDDLILGRAPNPVDTADRAENGRTVASVLALVLGPFGAHRLYLGTTPKVAVIYGITFAGFGTLVLLDLGHLLFSKDLEPFRNNDRVFMWNPRSEGLTPP